MGEKMNDINITQSFYNSMVSQYDKLFLDWETTTHEQAAFLGKMDLIIHHKFLIVLVELEHRQLDLLCLVIM